MLRTFGGPGCTCGPEANSLTVTKHGELTMEEWRALFAKHFCPLCLERFMAQLEAAHAVEAGEVMS